MEKGGIFGACGSPVVEGGGSVKTTAGIANDEVGATGSVMWGQWGGVMVFWPAGNMPRPTAGLQRPVGCGGAGGGTAWHCGSVRGNRRARAGGEGGGGCGVRCLPPWKKTRTTRVSASRQGRGHAATADRSAAQAAATSMARLQPTAARRLARRGRGVTEPRRSGQESAREAMLVRPATAWRSCARRSAAEAWRTAAATRSVLVRRRRLQEWLCGGARL